MFEMLSITSAASGKAKDSIKQKQMLRMAAAH
jgi:hypothetical protein